MTINKTNLNEQNAVSWISTDWLAAHLSQSEILILDVQPNVHDYIQEHIPGALYFPEGLMRQHSGRLPSSYVNEEAAQAILRATGVQEELPLVVYTGLGAVKKWGDGLEQTMLAYSLARFGHPCIFLLDGGLDKWKAEGKPISQVFPEARRSSFQVRRKGDFAVSIYQVKHALEDPGTILLDARPAAVYQGQGPWPMAGHIPGAVNLPWRGLMDAANPSLLRSDIEIADLLQQAGVSPSSRLIVSCGTGREATNEFLLFKFHLGYPDVRIYEGSFTEWSADPNNPTIVGPFPR